MNNRSFTLIELLVVIIIIGILAGVITVSVSNFIIQSQNTKLIAELSNLSNSLEGYSHYYQGSLCIEDNTNNAGFKSFLGITNVPVHPNYPANATALTTNNCFLYFSDGTNYSIRVPAMGNNGYLIQESRNPQTKSIQTSCENGWIPFGNRCVMKYEARNIDGKPVSQANGTPWRQVNWYVAKAACELMGAHIMTNAEWMAIARDIEQVKDNWTGGEVGSGVINRGQPGSAIESIDPLSGENKRIHVLSNGQEIWDFAGNLYEWIDEKIDCEKIRCSDELMLYTSNPDSGWHEFSEIVNWGGYSKSILTSFENYDSNDGIGKIYTSINAARNGTSSDKYSHVFLRGGGSGGPIDTQNIRGIFTLNLDHSPSAGSEHHYGFRCVK
ncbi:MAG: SUMF1/EgtB/PvdO family nonheme iron enzyme [Bacilli bacterium]|nr:prepilin-type N-terminal cleavage/methylation domain-containing protein [Massilibacteroides sp.]MDD4624564.1 prepilin-type N-terminal cleavage/methylation domain-containing protein [Bacilli bacterium]